MLTEVRRSPPVLALDVDPTWLAQQSVLWLEPPASQVWTNLAKRREGTGLVIQPGGSTWRHLFVDPLAVVLARDEAPAAGDPPASTLEVRLALPARPRALALLTALRSMGVGRVTPVRFARSLPRRHDARMMAELAERFGPWVSPPIGLDDALADAPRWLESRAPEPLPAREHGDTAGDARALLVGPEGGPTNDELARIRLHAFSTHALGPRTLRSETAAVTAAALRLLGRGSPYGVG
ncbi:MAG: 16S rRNA (uracil(1498)-N(3))-methyltransferase [Planctomycetota bacterium]